MKRVFTVVLVTAALVVPMFQASSVQALDKSTCSFQSLESGWWTVRENRLTVECFARKFGVSADMASLIASHESGFNERAWNSSSSAAGLYQHLYRYWPSRVASHAALLSRWDVSNREWHSPRAQAVVSMAIARSSGWGPMWCDWASYC